MGFFTWIGRVFLWVFLLPVGVWRSLRHHRRKAENRAVERMRSEFGAVPKTKIRPLDDRDRVA